MAVDNSFPASNPELHVSKGGLGAVQHGKQRYLARKMLAPRASIVSVLDSRTLSRTGRCRSTKHPLLHAGRRRRDSAWLLTTSRNSLMQERKRAISPTTR